MCNLAESPHSIGLLESLCNSRKADRLGMTLPTVDGRLNTGQNPTSSTAAEPHQPARVQNGLAVCSLSIGESARRHSLLAEDRRLPTEVSTFGPVRDLRRLGRE